MIFVYCRREKLQDSDGDCRGSEADPTIWETHSVPSRKWGCELGRGGRSAGLLGASGAPEDHGALHTEFNAEKPEGTAPGLPGACLTWFLLSRHVPSFPFFLIPQPEPQHPWAQVRSHLLRAASRRHSVPTQRPTSSRPRVRSQSSSVTWAGGRTQSRFIGGKPSPGAAGRVQGSPALHACLQAEQRRRSGLGTLYLFFLGEISHGDLQSGRREVVVWAQGSSGASWRRDSGRTTLGFL